MKENILYAYHMEASHLKEFHDYSSFQFQGKTFYFTKLKRNQKEFQELLQVMQELLQKNIPILTFVQNVQGSFVTMVGSDAYVLMEVQEETIEYGLLDILDFQNKLVLNHRHSSLYRNEWANLWSQKVDYFEYQMHELGKNYPILLNSFSYYVGLAENAICYARNVQNSFPDSNYHRGGAYRAQKLGFGWISDVRKSSERMRSAFFSGGHGKKQSRQPHYAAFGYYDSVSDAGGGVPQSGYAHDYGARSFRVCVRYRGRRDVRESNESFLEEENKSHDRRRRHFGVPDVGARSTQNGA